MMQRVSDARLLNEIANHPEVRPFGGNGLAPLDFGLIVSDRRNFAFASALGFFFLHRRVEDEYEGHAAFLPSGRGFHALKCGRWVQREMFGRRACREIVVRIPKENLAALGLVLSLGFKRFGSQHEKHILKFTDAMWRARRS